MSLFMSLTCSENTLCVVCNVQVAAYEKEVGVKIKDEAEMYIITLSAHGHMLLGSSVKTSQRERDESESQLCVNHSSRGWRQWEQTSLGEELADLGVTLTMALVGIFVVAL